MEKQTAMPLADSDKVGMVLTRLPTDIGFDVRCFLNLILMLFEAE